ncbi:MAG: SDR family NAD-dependent epimerase/dehydratase, partial [Phaeodactylibacter sp.]|nr:SDR family NAD-dependent epimerase/dehydratase [Phaeodactylibacter sp.]
DFAQEIIELVGNPEAKIVYRDLPKDDPKVRQPDISLARKLLGWEPKVPREEGLMKTFEYFRKHVPPPQP